MPLYTRRERRNLEWKMLKTILMLEEGEVQDREAEGWNVEGEKRRATRKECKRCREQFEASASWRKQGNVTLLFRL